jgi:HK97 family phage major capsid protein
MDNLKKLQDEAAALANRIDAVRAIEGDADKIAERDLELETLTADASKLSKKIDFERTVAESAKNLRSVVERCSPAAEVTEERSEKARVEAVPYSGRLRAFAKAEDAYKAGMWFKAKGGDAHAKRWCEDHGVEVRALGGASGGGASFVPDILSTTVLRLVEQYSAFAQNATSIQMPSDVVLFPKRTAGNSAAWISENSAITPADPNATQVTVTAKKLAAAVVISSELLQDSIVSIADWVAAELALGISNAVEAAAFSGNPSNAPNVAGLVTSHAGGLIKTTTAGQSTTYDYAASLVTAAGDTPDEVTKANLLAMMAAVPQHSRAGAKWFVSPFFFSACMQNLDLNQGGSVGLSQGLGLTFLGSPVVLTDRLPSGADSTGVVMALYGNMANSSIYGTRAGLEIQSSDQVNFLSDQTVIRAIARVAISHHTIGDASNAGPMIALVGA